MKYSRLAIPILFLLLVVSLASALPVFAQSVVIQSNIGQSNGGSDDQITTFTSDVAQNNLLVVTASCSNPSMANCGSLDISDSGGGARCSGDSWNVIASQFSDSYAGVEAWYCVAATSGGEAVTVTTGGSGDAFLTVGVMELQMASTGTIDTGTGNGEGPCPCELSTNVNGQDGILIGVVAMNMASSPANYWTQTSGYTCLTDSSVSTTYCGSGNTEPYNAGGTVEYKVGVTGSSNLEFSTNHAGPTGEGKWDEIGFSFDFSSSTTTTSSSTSTDTTTSVGPPPALTGTVVSSTTQTTYIWQGLNSSLVPMNNNASGLTSVNCLTNHDPSEDVFNNNTFNAFECGASALVGNIYPIYQPMKAISMSITFNSGNINSSDPEQLYLLMWSGNHLSGLLQYSPSVALVNISTEAGYSANTTYTESFLANSFNPCNPSPLSDSYCGALSYLAYGGIQLIPTDDNWTLNGNILNLPVSGNGTVGYVAIGAFVVDCGINPVNNQTSFEFGYYNESTVELESYYSSGSPPAQSTFPGYPSWYLNYQTPYYTGQTILSTLFPLNSTQVPPLDYNVTGHYNNTVFALGINTALLQLPVVYSTVTTTSTTTPPQDLGNCNGIVACHNANATNLFYNDTVYPLVAILLFSLILYILAFRTFEMGLVGLTNGVIISVVAGIIPWETLILVGILLAFAIAREIDLL